MWDARQTYNFQQPGRAMACPVWCPDSLISILTSLGGDTFTLHLHLAYYTVQCSAV